ncbi:MAG: transporter ATP-binding protein [Klenkia sp.]|nr:transporter ATP-binding protein [Klenkia sp.]
MTEATPLRLSAEGITKTYGAFAALTDVTFELRAGEVMALLGENGAGKSTIVKILSGLVAADAGTVTIDGEPVTLTGVASSQAAGIAVVQQEYSTVRTMTVAENLFLGQRSAPWWWRPGRLVARSKAVLARVGLQDLDPRTRVEQLTVAEMQLLEIARVLARDARIIVFDEPTAALSDAEIVRVLEAARRLASEGRSIVYVTHRLGEVFEIADRVTIFRNGRSSAPLEVADLDVDGVVARMIGRELGDLYPPRSSGLGDVALEARGLVAPGFRAPVDLVVRRGEVLGITGQLGSGTTELIEALASLRPVIDGSLHVGGREVTLRNRRAGIAAGIAYCSADRKRDGIFPGASIRQNLSSPWVSTVARAGFIRSGHEGTATRTLAEEFAVDTTRLGTRVGSLSGGNQQKVAVGKWSGTQPDVLLVEEPTRGVDVGARADMYATLRALADSGMAVVVSSSDTNEVLGLSDTVATFYHGRPTAVRPATEWTEHDLVREVMHREEVLT